MHGCVGRRVMRGSREGEKAAVLVLGPISCDFCVPSWSLLFFVTLFALFPSKAVPCGVSDSGKERRKNKTRSENGNNSWDEWGKTEGKSVPRANEGRRFVFLLLLRIVITATSTSASAGNRRTSTCQSVMIPSPVSKINSSGRVCRSEVP